MQFVRDDPATWPSFRPRIIAHDVGRSRDRSTAVVGGNSPIPPRLLGFVDFIELPQGLFGTERANALAEVDRHYGGNSHIVADLSFDPTYAEVLYDTFGPRVIGLQIGRHGDGMTFERWQVRNDAIPVYNVGRSYLLESFHNELISKLVRFVDGPMARRAFEQLTTLEAELRDSGTVYSCPSGLHDDLAISLAMLSWWARHPHLPAWLNYLDNSHASYVKREPMSNLAWT